MGQAPQVSAGCWVGAALLACRCTTAGAFWPLAWSRVLAVAWSRGADGRVAQATVEMAAPILAHGRIPARIDGVAADARVVAHAVDLARRNTLE